MIGERFEPDWALPPGDFLREELNARGWSAVGLATAAGLQLDVVDAILTGGELDDGTADKLGMAFGTSAQFWKNLEIFYRGHLARKQQPGSVA